MVSLDYIFALSGKTKKQGETFEEHGISLDNPFKVIYYVKNGVLFPTQINSSSDTAQVIPFFRMISSIS